MKTKTVLSVALAVTLALAFAGIVYATGSYSTVIVPTTQAALGKKTTIPCNLEKATGACAVTLSGHSSIGILKACVGKGTGYVNLTTVTYGARATTNYVTRQPYKEIFVDWTALKKRTATNRDQKASFVWW